MPTCLANELAPVQATQPLAPSSERLESQASHLGNPKHTHASPNGASTRSIRGKGGDQLVSRLAIAYVRVSTEDQKLGPEVQRAAIEAYAAREGIGVLSWHVDAGISGAAPISYRPGLAAAIDAARMHRAHLIVAKRDRLARDAMIAAMVDRSLSKGCSVIAADGSGNGSAPADALMRTILDGMAEYERALIRSRTKAALQAKRSRGEAAGKAPYGFDVDASGRLVPNEAEQRTIARIRELAASGKGSKAIVAILASEGFLSRKGTPLQRTQVRRILAA